MVIRGSASNESSQRNSPRTLAGARLGYPTPGHARRTTAGTDAEPCERVACSGNGLRPGANRRHCETDGLMAHASSGRAPRACGTCPQSPVQSSEIEQIQLPSEVRELAALSNRLPRSVPLASEVKARTAQRCGAGGQAASAASPPEPNPASGKSKPNDPRGCFSPRRSMQSTWHAHGKHRLVGVLSEVR